MKCNYERKLNIQVNNAIVKNYNKFFKSHFFCNFELFTAMFFHTFFIGVIHNCNISKKGAVFISA